MEAAEVQKIVKLTIEEMKKSGMLKELHDTAYKEVSAALFQYYAGCKTEEIKKALQFIQNDTYYEIIPMYYRNRMTIERIAEYFGVEISTITRNKKRLCLLMWEYVS